MLDTLDMLDVFYAMAPVVFYTTQISFSSVPHALLSCGVFIK